MDKSEPCCAARKKHEDEGSAPISFEVWGAFTLLLDGTTGGVEITHCPWCGGRLHLDNQELKP